MEPKERTDRTWLWILVAVVVVVILGAGLWNRRAPANSVNQSVIDNIQRDLAAEGYILTNSMRMRSEAVVLGIPVSRILGTVENSVSLPLRRNGSELKIDYKIKGGRAFNISIWTDLTNSARAARIAESLRQSHPVVSVQIWTNSPAP